MHVVLISQCEKKAILRTAKVLDAYAVRHGDRTWITPITKDGLIALHRELRSRGTRQTAVSCYVNDGARRLKLLWTVGRKSAFGLAGAVAVATKEQSNKDAALTLSPSIRIACLLAECAGLAHDFGKFGTVFQAKLNPPTDSKKPNAPKPFAADPIRHEWISLQILLSLLDGKSWAEGWNATKPLRMTDYYQLQPHGIQKGLVTIESVLAFLVVSHHRLPSLQRKGTIPGDSEYIQDNACGADGKAIRPNPFVSEPPPLLLKRIEHLLSRIRAFALPDASPDAMRAIATLARMALILADHQVSGIDKTQAEGHGPSIENSPGAVFANTHKCQDGKRIKNQELSWHLTNVGNQAGMMVKNMLTFQPSGLSSTTIDTIRERSTGRFQWQNLCADAIEQTQSLERLPTLVINIAATGCGKTRMNVRAIAALRPPTADGIQEPLRIAAAFNLRTLTLQTRDAFADQFKLNEKELACVLGSQIAVRLHAAGKVKAELFDEDENDPEDEFDFDGAGDPPPEWLHGFLEKKPVLKPLLMTPIVVSTIDFLISAGEPHKQGNYGLAMLRMMHSDLILDEIDAYDPKAMLAVARLVTAAAMWGRHVIASSATLSAPVATVLYDAFALGIRLKNALDGHHTTWRQIVIDDKTTPLIISSDTRNEFDSAFKSHIDTMMRSLGRQHFRPAELQQLERAGTKTKGRENFVTAVESACNRMHDRHAWAPPTNDTGFTGKISFGLVRVANVKTAVFTARELATAIPTSRICCYHAQVGLLQRWNIERTLDAVLNRKEKDWKHKSTSKEFVLDAMRKAAARGQNTIHFIIVATPVEEIGRDHDFDWAVIEPSSSQSIVQTAGRVNRHRLDKIEHPNIAVLQFNYRECIKTVSGAPVFCQPGLELESDMSHYGNHDLAELLNWPEILTAGQIDARLRYQTEIHPFALADDKSLTEAVRPPMKQFVNSEGFGWLLKDTYTKSPLRDKGGIMHEEWCFDENGNYLKKEPNGNNFSFKLEKRSLDKDHERHPNDWLVLNFNDMIKLAMKHHISIEIASSVQVLSYGDGGQTLVHRDKSFGYTSEKYSAH